MARRSLMDLLAIPWVDKSIAVVASLPFAFELYRRWVIGHVNFPRAVLGLQLLVIILLMVLRTAPVRVTPNPWFWLLAFVTTYATLGFTAFAGQGVSLISPILGNGLAVVSMMILLYALLSLGRNIGFIPAQREVVMRGAYGFCKASDLYRYVRLAIRVCPQKLLGAEFDDGSDPNRAPDDQRHSRGALPSRGCKLCSVSEGSPLEMVPRYCLSRLRPENRF